MKQVSKILFILVFFHFTLTYSQKISKIEREKIAIAGMLDDFNLKAANSNFDGYFDLFTEDAVFIGTDATENWNKSEFKKYAKPYFDKKKTWNFKSIERNIYFAKGNNIAWFDELLSTQMKICRGSGVVQKVGKTWKVKQYVLSMTIPNDNTNEVVKIKTKLEDALMEKLKSD
jgi:hypothetical protein